jgi:proteasome assembly chaperone (PAC2) family protein
MEMGKLPIMYHRRYLEVPENSLKSPVALVGLPGIANVGKIAIETLARVRKEWDKYHSEVHSLSL